MLNQNIQEQEQEQWKVLHMNKVIILELLIAANTGILHPTPIAKFPIFHFLENLEMQGESFSAVLHNFCRTNLIWGSSRHPFSSFDKTNLIFW